MRSNARADRGARPSAGRSHDDLCAVHPKRYDKRWNMGRTVRAHRNSTEDMRAEFGLPTRRSTTR
jgi:hypothetical protein